MKILHISAECFPAAKAGGLGDVVGALPKYLTKRNYETAVVLPKYSTPYMQEAEWNEVYRGVIRIHNYYYPFTILKQKGDKLGFPFYTADIPGKFDRPGIYQDPGGWNYEDDISRWLAFQMAVLIWLTHDTNIDPQILHCHDHHTALIPFMIQHCPDYKSLSNKPTVFTIHNGMYQGAFGWDQLYQMPYFDPEARGLLDWNNMINPMATAIKTAWRVTTVSDGYLDELKQDAQGLESLFWYEQQKSQGIINGIDAVEWDPKTDKRLAFHFNGKNIATFKKNNKAALQERFAIHKDKPLITFIGRLVHQKGADMIPDLIHRMVHSGLEFSFVVLGTGERYLHQSFESLKHQYFNFFDTSLEYNETLAHQLYAGSDFLFMPSRVEPCGLNQMYACRYGTIPIVRSVGGLKDSIPDIGEAGNIGRGIRFDHFNLDDAFHALYRAVAMYQDRKSMTEVRKRIMNYDFSWESSVEQYIEMYESLLNVKQ